MAPVTSTGRVLQTDEGLNVLLNIPDSAKVVAFKPERPGLWAIKVRTLGFQVESLGLWAVMWVYQQDSRVKSQGATGFAISREWSGLGGRSERSRQKLQCLAKLAHGSDSCLG